MRIYSEPSKANDTCTLPDIEVFFWTDYDGHIDNPDMEPGFYWWTCLPGCLPDSTPFGPYETEEAAIEAAQDIY